MIRNFEPRLYQQTIFGTCAQRNTMVVLPTGMGKTNILMMLAVHRLTLYPNSKILILAPTRPLLNQHIETFKKHMDIAEDQFAVFTGQVSPDKRAELWRQKSLIFSTPQGLENDLLSNRISIVDVSLLAFDEAHRATGDYSYNFIADFYSKYARHPRIIALTASPGSNVEKIQEVAKNLHIEDIEVRTEDDADVKQYVQKVDITYVPVNLTGDTKKVLDFLNKSSKAKMAELRNMKLIQKASLHKGEMLKLQQELAARMHAGERDFEVLKGMSVLAEAMKVAHAIELAETQGTEQLGKYFEKLRNEAQNGKTKAAKNLMLDTDFKAAMYLTEEASTETNHPKLEKLVEIVQEATRKKPDEKIIIFANYRDTGAKIVSKLGELGKQARLFVGQMKKADTGMSQKEQKRVIEEFREGLFNILVATSVAEEGLDIPNVDLVLFYEPVPSAIRSIQRKGRTARHSQGKVLILITNDTRDVVYKWSAHHKERKMHSLLSTIKKDLALSGEPRKTNTKLGDFMDELMIFVDAREKGSAVIKELIAQNCRITMKGLEVGDYLLSDRVVVEYKTQEDFIASLLDGRLFEQAKNLKHYPNPLIMIEGNNDLYSLRNVHPNSLRGLISSLIVDYGIPIVYTKDANDSAAYLMILAKREQEAKGRQLAMHSKKPLSLAEQQEYLVSSLPGIGPALSKPLLQKFKRPIDLFNASSSEMQSVSLIGEAKASEIRKILDSEYAS